MVGHGNDLKCHYIYEIWESDFYGGLEKNRGVYVNEGKAEKICESRS